MGEWEQRFIYVLRMNAFVFHLPKFTDKEICSRMPHIHYLCLESTRSLRKKACVIWNCLIAEVSETPNSVCSGLLKYIISLSKSHLSAILIKLRKVTKCRSDKAMISKLIELLKRTWCIQDTTFRLHMLFAEKERSWSVRKSSLGHEFVQ